MRSQGTGEGSSAGDCLPLRRHGQQMALPGCSQPLGLRERAVGRLASPGHSPSLERSAQCDPGPLAASGGVLAPPHWAGVRPPGATTGDGAGPDALWRASGAWPALGAPALRSGPGLAQARAGAGAWGQRRGALRMSGAARARQAAARSGRGLPGVSSSRPAARGQEHGPAPLSARAGRDLGSAQRGPGGRSVVEAFPRGPGGPMLRPTPRGSGRPHTCAAATAQSRGPAGTPGTAHSPSGGSASSFPCFVLGLGEGRGGAASHLPGEVRAPASPPPPRPTAPNPAPSAVSWWE